MGSLEFWSMLVIFYQTIISVVISWLTLDCQFMPHASELHEITLMKVLYLYDPEACGRIYFYNVTNNINLGRVYTSVVWPVKNQIAASFRTKIQLWLSLHVVWMIFSIINVTQRERSCSFYATLLPFTMTGVTLLIVDATYAALFLFDARYTYSESSVLHHLAVRGQMRAMSKKPITPSNVKVEDTAWIAVLLAYISVRGIVQWVINFWIVKDNYYEGLERYRKKQRQSPKQKLKQLKSSSFMEL